MPLFDYICQHCGYACEEYRKVGESAPMENCPRCKKLEYMKMIGLPHTDMKHFAKPIEMYSVAANTQEEIDDLRRKCPDLKISTNPRDEMWGIPIARNRKEKLAILKAVGYIEKT